MLLAPSALILAATACAAAASLRLELPGFLLTAYVVAVGEIVLVTELLSLDDRVGRWGYLVLQVPLLAAALATWNASGRARPQIAPFAWEAAVRAHPALAVLAVVVAGALAYELFLVVSVPPTTWDGLSYHLSRAAGWQDGGGLGFAPAHTTRENVLPPNGEIQILYTFAFLDSDVLAAAPQLLAQLAILVAIYGCARRLGFARPASAFAALLYATLSEVALEATSTQNDLVVAAPIAATYYFVLGGRERELPLAGLALGIAAGTKLTFATALPALLLLAALLLPTRALLRGAACTVAAFALVGAYVYAENLDRDGRPLGISPEAEAFRPELDAGGLVSTSVRVLADFADLSGLDVPGWLQRGVADGTRTVFEKLAIEPNPPGATSREFAYEPNTSSDEDLSYFGPLGLLLVLPLALGYAIAGPLRRTDGARSAVAWSLPLFVLGIALTHRYNPWIGRFLTLPVALVLPLAASLYTRRAVTAVVVALAAITLVSTHSENVVKRPRDRPWAKERSVAMTARRPELAGVVAAVDEDVPADASLVAALGVDDWDYPFYGARLRRRLIELPPEQAFELGIPYVLVGSVEPQPAVPPGWSVRAFPNGWRLVTRD